MCLSPCQTADEFSNFQLNLERLVGQTKHLTSTITVVLGAFNAMSKSQIKFVTATGCRHTWKTTKTLKKTVFFVTLRENLENSGNFEDFPGNFRRFC